MAEYERMADRIARREVTEKDGVKVLKATGEQLKTCIQNLETKVIAGMKCNQDRAIKSRFCATLSQRP